MVEVKSHQWYRTKVFVGWRWTCARRKFIYFVVLCKKEEEFKYKWEELTTASHPYPDIVDAKATCTQFFLFILFLCAQLFYLFFFKTTITIKKVYLHPFNKLEKMNVSWCCRWKFLALKCNWINFNFIYLKAIWNLCVMSCYVTRGGHFEVKKSFFLSFGA